MHLNKTFLVHFKSSHKVMPPKSKKLDARSKMSKHRFAKVPLSILGLPLHPSPHANGKSIQNDLSNLGNCASQLFPSGIQHPAPLSRHTDPPISSRIYLLSFNSYTSYSFPFLRCNFDVTPLFFQQLRTLLHCVNNLVYSRSSVTFH